jgi:hypothetical protein
MSKISLVLSLFLSFVACTKKTGIVTKTPTADTQNSLSNEPQILFIQVKIVQKDKDSPLIATVVDKKMVNGQLDKPLQGIELIEGKWLISLLDADKKMIVQEIVQDPINQNFEYLNDKGKLDNVTVVKKETDCFVRVQFDAKFQYLKCESIVEKKALKPLFQIKL